MDPIPLRTIAVLLNYERTTTDPRFVGRQLVDYIPTKYSKESPYHILNPRKGEATKNLSKTVRSRHEFVFSMRKNVPTNVPARTTCEIGPNCTEAVRNLPPKRLEIIFQETRNLDGCLRAIRIYDKFVEHCSPGQLFSIQVAGEEPLLISDRGESVFMVLRKIKMISSINLEPSGPHIATRTEDDSGTDPHFVSHSHQSAYYYYPKYC